MQGNQIKNLIILAVMGFVVYANAMKGPFMLDDYPFLSDFEHKSISSHFIPDPSKLGIANVRTQHAYYRPLAHVVPHLNYLVFKQNPFAYHVTNILLVILAGWCVVLLLTLFMAPTLALMSGILFIIHPINGLMVNYITASVFAVQVICMTLALYFTFKPSIRMRDTIASVLFFSSSLLCHETSFMLPFYAVLLGFMNTSKIKEVFVQTKFLWFVLLGYILFRAFNVPLSRSLFHSVANTGLSFDQATASVMALLSWYMQKLLVPQDIFLMWSIPFGMNNSWDWVAGGVVVLFLTGYMMVRCWAKHKKAVLLLMWFLIGLLPIFLGAFATESLGALLEPHWFIPATVGLFASIVLLVNALVGSAWIKKAVLAVSFIFLGSCSWSNNRLWSSEIGLYERWLQVSPEFKAIHYFLGNLYDRQGQYEQARVHLEQSILGRYKDWMVYMQLGQIDMKEGKYPHARVMLNKAYSLEPRQTDVLNSLGALEFFARNMNEAVMWFERSIEVNRFNIEPRKNLGIVYSRMGEKAKAKITYEAILQISPGNAQAQEALRRL